MSKITLKISPTFFLTAGLIGFLNSSSLIGTLVWMGIILISVLFHELGHALFANLFGQKTTIELSAFGGLTIPRGKKLDLWKEFVVILMGPAFGFLLFVLASIYIQFPYGTPFVRSVVEKIRYVNLFWTFVNLLPILPLDGGQLVRVVLEWILGPKSLKATLYVSFFVASLFSIVSFLIGVFLIGAIFLLFAYQSMEGIRSLKHFTDDDTLEDNRKLLRVAEVLIGHGDYAKAESVLESLKEKTNKGMIYNLASEYLAKISYDKHDYKKAYDLLINLGNKLSQEGKLVLYLAAYEIGDYEKVVDLSGVCFQESQTLEVAIRAAKSNAMLQDIKKSIEWLKTVRSFDGIDLLELTSGKAFDSIRNNDLFQNFMRSISRD
jgi:stage IV sporulation protein FB